jgi:hypothetical protein
VALWLIARSHLILLEPERLLSILPGGQP